MMRRIINAAADIRAWFSRCLRFASLMLLSGSLSGCFVVERPILGRADMVPPDMPGHYSLSEVTSHGEVPSGHGRLTEDGPGLLRWQGTSQEGRQSDWRFVVQEVADGSYLLESSDMMEKPVLLLVRREADGFDIVLPAMDDGELASRAQAHGIAYRRGVEAIGSGGIGLEGDASRIVGFFEDLMKGETRPLIRLVRSTEPAAAEPSERGLADWRRLVGAWGKALPVTAGFHAPRLDDGPDLLWWLKVDQPFPSQWDGVEVPVEVASRGVGSVHVFFAGPGAYPFIDFDKVTGLRYEPAVLANLASSFVSTGLERFRREKDCPTAFTVAAPNFFSVGDDRFRVVRERLVPRQEGAALAQRAFFWRTVDGSLFVARLSLESERRGLSGGHYRLVVAMEASILRRICQSAE